MLAQILQLALRIVGIVERILALIGVIQDEQRIIAREHIPYLIEDAVVATSLNVANPTYGLQAIETMLADVQAKVDAIYADYQQRTQPVTLPATPPAGYGGSKADEVWSYPLDANGQTTADYLDWAGNVAWSIQQMVSFENGTSPLFLVNGDFAGFWNAPVFTSWPTADMSTAAPGTDLVAWLNDQNPGWTWYYDFQGGNYAVATHPDYPAWSFTFRYSREEFQAILYANALANGTIQPGQPVPPVWPGLSKVTLGAAVTFGPNDLGVTVPGPMDGVLIAITAYPAYKGTFNFAGDVSVRNIGAITFTSDHGQDEFPQLLGFQQAVYCPKSMTRAQSAKLRIVQGTSGTITPWTRTP